MKCGSATIAQGCGKGTGNKPKVAMGNSSEDQCNVEKYSLKLAIVPLKMVSVQ